MKDFKIIAQKQTNKTVLEVTEVYIIIFSWECSFSTHCLTGISNLYHALNDIILQFIEEVQGRAISAHHLYVGCLFLLTNEYEDMPDNFRPFKM